MNPGSANSVSSRDTSSWLYRCAVDATAVPAMCGALRPWWAAGFMDVEFVVAVMPIPTTGVVSKADRGQGELEHYPPPTETRHHDDGTAAKDICCEDDYERSGPRPREVVFCRSIWAASRIADRI